MRVRRHAQQPLDLPDSAPTPGTQAGAVAAPGQAFMTYGAGVGHEGYVSFGRCAPSAARSAMGLRPRMAGPCAARAGRGQPVGAGSRGGSSLDPAAAWRSREGQSWMQVGWDMLFKSGWISPAHSRCDPGIAPHHSSQKASAGPLQMAARCTASAAGSGPAAEVEGGERAQLSAAQPARSSSGAEATWARHGAKRDKAPCTAAGQWHE